MKQSENVNNSVSNADRIVKWVLIILATIFLAVMLILPLIYVVATAFRDGWSAFVKAVSDKYAVKSVLLTVKVTLITVVVNTIFGIFAAWTITKFKFRGKKLLSALIDLPLAISPIIAGLIFVLTFGRSSAWNRACDYICDISIHIEGDYPCYDFCGNGRGRSCGTYGSQSVSGIYAGNTAAH